MFRRGNMKKLALLSVLFLFACSNTKDPFFAVGDPGFWLLGPYRLSVYFNDPGVDESTMRDKKVDQRLVDLITDAEKTVDLAVYNLGRQSIIDAVILAHERGVRVRMVGDVDEAATDGYRKIEFYRQIPFALGNATGIQHNKFAVVDNKYMFMGTGNYSDSDLMRNNNNFMVIESETLAREYTREFDQMFYGRFAGTKVPAITQQRLHYVNMTPIELYFSPYDGNEAIRRMVEIVDNAQVQVQFMIFAYTHDELSAAMIRAARRGVLVRGIHDSTFIVGTSEEAPRLYSAGNYMSTGPFNRKDGNENTSILGVAAHGGKLHTKTMIVDGSIVCTGSFNWSTNAVDNNDENMLVIHSPFVAAELQQQWENVWAVSTAMSGPLKHVSGEPASPGDIVISEIMWAGSYDSAGQYTNDDDWIELRNMTSRTIDLSHWSINWDTEGFINYPLPDEYNWYEPSVHTRHRSLGRLTIPPNGYFILTNANAAIPTDSGDNKLSGTKTFNLDSGSFKVRLYDNTMRLIDEAGNGDPPLSGKQDGVNRRTFSMERFFTAGGVALPGAAVGSWYTSNGDNDTAAGTLGGTGILDSNYKFCDFANDNCTIGTPNYSGSSSAVASTAFGGINNELNRPIDAYSTGTQSAVIQMRWALTSLGVLNCTAGCVSACGSYNLDPSDPSKILLNTTGQSSGALCTINVIPGSSNDITGGFAAGGNISFEGHGTSPATFKIHMVAPANCSSEDVIVLQAQTSGTMQNLGVYYYDSFTPNPQLLYRMHDAYITAGQYVYVRLDLPNNLSEDNLIGSNPTINMGDATAMGNCTTPAAGTPNLATLGDANTYEVFSQKAGISSTDGAIFISYNLSGAPMDLMCYTNGDGDMAEGLMMGGMRSIFRMGTSVYNLPSFPVDTVNDYEVQTACSRFTGTSSNYLQRTTDTNRGSDFTQM